MKAVVTQPSPRMVIQREPSHVVALAAARTPEHSVAHGGEKYAKFAYSTVFGFSVPKSDGLEGRPSTPCWHLA